MGKLMAKLNGCDRSSSLFHSYALFFRVLGRQVLLASWKSCCSSVNLASVRLVFHVIRSGRALWAASVQQNSSLSSSCLWGYVSRCTCGEIGQIPPHIFVVLCGILISKVSQTFKGFQITIVFMVSSEIIVPLCPGRLTHPCYSS